MLISAQNQNRNQTKTRLYSPSRFHSLFRSPLLQTLQPLKIECGTVDVLQQTHCNKAELWCRHVLCLTCLVRSTTWGPQILQENCTFHSPSRSLWNIAKQASNPRARLKLLLTESPSTPRWQNPMATSVLILLSTVFGHLG